MIEHDHTDIETLATLYECVRALLDERDRLRTLTVDDLVAVVGVLRRDYAERSEP